MIDARVNGRRWRRLNGLAGRYLKTWSYLRPQAKCIVRIGHDRRDEVPDFLISSSRSRDGRGGEQGRVRDTRMRSTVVPASPRFALLPLDTELPVAVSRCQPTRAAGRLPMSRRCGHDLAFMPSVKRAAEVVPALPLGTSVLGGPICPRPEMAGNDAMTQNERALTPLGDLPGPRGLPLLGNLHRIRFDWLHLILEEWAERYGAIFRIRSGPHRIAVISDRSAIQRILVQRPGGLGAPPRSEILRLASSRPSFLRDRRQQISAPASSEIDLGIVPL